MNNAEKEWENVKRKYNLPNSLKLSFIQNYILLHRSKSDHGNLEETVSCEKSNQYWIANKKE